LKKLDIKCNLYAGLCNNALSFKQVANVSGLGEGFDSTGMLNRTVRNLYRFGLRRAHRVFFQNPDDRLMCIRQGLVPAASSVLLPGSGVDLAQFEPSPPEPSQRRRFLMFGRLLPRKGFYRFVSAARTLRSKHGERAEFSILGGADKERPESVELLEHIRQAHVDGVVTYHAPTDNVLPILRASDVVVLPSTYNEGVPRSLLEALACAKPIVTTEWKGCRETVIDGLNGRLVRSDDDSSFTDALESLLLEAPERLHAMGLNSRKLAEERFDERLVLAAYLSAMGLPVDAEAPIERRAA
jgi:glycosyltransferase involved in cell wall biosynthesis